MNTKAQYYFLAEKGLTTATPEDLIRLSVDRLIEALYKPDFELNWKVDKERLKMFGIEKESINWGDLSVDEIHQNKRGYYEVIVHEAGPEQCETFCAYIEQHMAAWGWDVTVKTEW